jgi:AcrR family transcriptional regulator
MTTARKPLRADAERNRRRVLDAALEVFADRGLDVGIDESREPPGVGSARSTAGSRPRRSWSSPSWRIASRPCSSAWMGAARQPDPWEAFAEAMTAIAEIVGRDRGLLSAMHEEPKLRRAFDERRATIFATLEPVLARAQRAGVVRADVVVEDLTALAAIATRLPAWRLRENPDLWHRYLGVVLDGLRPAGATPLPS